MANAKANIYNIPLNGPLETNDYKGGIKAFQGFNEKNAFFRDNALTPFWKKEAENSTQKSNTVVDKYGNSYYFKNDNYCYKKDISGTEEKLFYAYRGIHKELVSNNKDIRAYFNEDYYIYIERSNTWLTKIHTPIGEVTFYSSQSYDESYCGIEVHNGYFICYAGDYLRVYKTSDNSVVANRNGTAINNSMNKRCSKINNYLLFMYNSTSDSPSKYNNCIFWFNTDSETSGTQTFDNFYVDSSFELNNEIIYDAFVENKYYGAGISIANDTISIDYQKYRYENTYSYLSKTDYIDRNLFIRAALIHGIQTTDAHFATTWLLDGSMLSDQLDLDLSTDTVTFNLGLKSDRRNTFEILFNNGVISGLSTKAGKLIAEWNSVDAYFPIRFDYDNYTLYYKDNTGKIWKVYLNSEIKLSVYGNLIVSNADSRINAYDFTKNKLVELYSDFNNRIVTTSSVLFKDTAITFADFKASRSQRFMVSAVNALYELQDPYPSILLNPQSVYLSTNELENLLFHDRCFDDLFADVFIGTSAGECKYFDKQPYVESTLQDTTYPIDTTGNILYSPNVFSKFIESYINQDMIVNDSVGYPLVYSNQKLIFGYYMLSAVENIETMFNIQGQSYGIADNKIFSYNYNSGVISGISAIVNITNYKFIGNTTQKAYFWNTVDKSIYVFTGANILSLFSEAYKMKSFVKSAFDVTTQTVFIITEESVFLLNDQMCELKVPAVQNIFSFNKGFVFVTASSVIYYSYISETGFDSEKLEIETCFYGSGDNVICINDTVYFRLFNANKSEGSVKVKVTTITNEQITTEETTIPVKASDWDNKTNSVYLRYQPKKQRGLGSSFAIESPFAITYLGVSSSVETLLVDRLSKGSINAPALNGEIDF